MKDKHKYLLSAVLVSIAYGLLSLMPFNTKQLSFANPNEVTLDSVPVKSLVVIHPDNKSYIALMATHKSNYKAIIINNREDVLKLKEVLHSTMSSTSGTAIYRTKLQQFLLIMDNNTLTITSNGDTQGFYVIRIPRGNIATVIQALNRGIDIRYPKEVS